MNMSEVNLKIKWIVCTVVFFASCASIQFAEGQQKVSKKAQSLFDEGLKMKAYGEYTQAISYFKQALKKDPLFINAYDALANTYQINNQLNASKNVYLTLIELNPNHYFGLYELGNVYFELGYLDSSEYYYRRFLKVNTSSDSYAAKAKLHLKHIDFSRDAMQHPVTVNPINLGSAINTPEQEYSPAFSIDEKTLFITRRVGSLSDIRPNEDLYFARKIEGNWQPIENIGSPINTQENEGAFSVSADGNYIFFTSCSRSGGKGQCDIWITAEKNGRWSQPMNLQSPINTKYWESQPSLSSDGRTLFFTSDRPGGYGGTDIWKSEFGENGWQAPINLGPTINTSRDEQFPFIHADNTTLYFSSEGHPGMGKSDIYVSSIIDENNWTKPKNLGYPINTNGQDWNLVVSRDGETAYFSSDQDGGHGGLDIYTFKLPKDIQATEVSYLRGFVRDASTKLPINASVELSPISGEQSTITYADGKEGTFIIPLKTNMQYALTIDKKGYLFHTENFDMPAFKSTKPFTLYIDLEKIALGNSVVLNNIFFDTDRFELKEESRLELNQLISFLVNNKTTQIEISGHTDNTGNAAYNLELSENRARSVYDYLIENQIEKDRISYKGYGDSNPIFPNDSDENRSKNRRTEFKIIGL